MIAPLPQINIAIDGFSSTGKSTVAKQLAKTLNYIYVDTGAMYRAVTYFAMQNNWIDAANVKTDEIVKHLDDIRLEFKPNKETAQSDMYLNGVNVEQAIRSMEVSGFVSPVATIPEVRNFLVEQQQIMGKNKGVVMDGRDIGSVVFPDAELKIFLTADAKVRAERRLLELREKGGQVTFEEIYDNVLERDHIDSTRKVAPLTKTNDAVEIDVTHINKEEQFEKIYRLALERIKALQIKS
ncbi:MAG: cytidylate kinase [Flavobacteriia bacterium]|nr:MAG: cytidylate kinase [Flavobacteriia bacterium]